MGRAQFVLVITAALLQPACADSAEPSPEVPAISYCEGVSDWDAAHAQFEVEVLELINARRGEGADCGGGGEFLTPTEPLTMQPALRCAARKHSQAMISEDFFEHESPDGETYQDRVALAEYDGEALAQSIAAGQHDPAQVVATWMSNDGNCANLMNPTATELGVGYLPADGVMYTDYWTLVFGHRG